jgi:citronellol/citronellal dehydrogenase
VAQAAAYFGGIDICVNNASAIQLTGTEATDMKRYDLMHQVNARGTFLVSKYCVPHLKRASNPHILALAPPLDMSPVWFGSHVAYTMAKYGMSMCMLGMAAEFKRDGIACNALWPRTVIATAAVEFAVGDAAMLQACRTPEIMADAAHLLLTRPAREFTGQFVIDDSLLYDNGVRDFEHYRAHPPTLLQPDFFVPRSSVPPPGVAATLQQPGAR